MPQWRHLSEEEVRSLPTRPSQERVIVSFPGQRDVSEIDPSAIYYWDTRKLIVRLLVVFSVIYFGRDHILPGYVARRLEKFTSYVTLGNILLTLCTGGVMTVLHHVLLAGGKPRSTYQQSERNIKLSKYMKVLSQSFYPSFLLSWGVAQTAYISAAKSPPRIHYHRQKLIAADGGTLGLDWMDELNASDPLPDDAPIVLLLPGINGSPKDNYLRRMAVALRNSKYRVVGFVYRGCGGLMLTTPKWYSSGHTEDVHLALHTIRKNFPNAKLGAVGFSMGANLLTCYMGETGDKCLLECGANVSNIYNYLRLYALDKPGYHPIGWILEQFVLKKILRTVKRNREVLDQVPGISVDRVLKTVRMLDWVEKCQSKLYGYDTWYGYIKQCIAEDWLPTIKKPLLNLNAEDDPMVPSTILKDVHCYARENENLMFVATRSGGHLGFISGWKPSLAPGFAEETVCSFLDFHLREH